MRSFGKLLIDATRKVTKTSRARIAGDDAHPHLVCHQDQMTGGITEHAQESLDFRARFIIDFFSIEKVAKPQCQAIDNRHLRIFRQRFQGYYQVKRFLNNEVGRIPFAPVALDAGPHLIICGFGGGNESFVSIGTGEVQGLLALATSTAPRYQGDSLHSE